jgi:hypothetical protein
MAPYGFLEECYTPGELCLMRIALYLSLSTGQKIKPQLNQSQIQLAKHD